MCRRDRLTFSVIWDISSQFLSPPFRQRFRWRECYHSRQVKARAWCASEKMASCRDVILLRVKRIASQPPGPPVMAWQTSSNSQNISLLIYDRVEHHSTVTGLCTCDVSMRLGWIDTCLRKWCVDSFPYQKCWTRIGKRTRYFFFSFVKFQMHEKQWAEPEGAIKYISWTNFFTWRTQIHARHQTFTQFTWKLSKPLFCHSSIAHAVFFHWE